MTPASIHSSSKAFYRGFELCYGNGLLANDGLKNAIVPAVVCLVFSIELSFKTILAGCNKPSEGHKFIELFSKLPAEIKAEIEKLVGANEADFLCRLTAVSNAFVEWRYIFEEPGAHTIEIDFLIKLHEALNQIGKKYVDIQRTMLMASKT